MSKDYGDKAVDFWFTAEGDYAVGDDGDIMSTEISPKRSLIQEIRTRVSAIQGDWSEHPALGLNLDSFVGRPLSDARVELIGKIMEEEIYKDGLAGPSEVGVAGLNLGRGIAMFRVVMTGYDQDLINFGYDTIDGIIRSHR